MSYVGERPCWPTFFCVDKHELFTFSGILNHVEGKCWSMAGQTGSQFFTSSVYEFIILVRPLAVLSYSDKCRTGRSSVCQHFPFLVLFREPVRENLMKLLSFLLLGLNDKCGNYGSTGPCRGKETVNRIEEAICSQTDNHPGVISTHASLLGCPQDDDDYSSPNSSKDRELYVCAANCKCKICVDDETEVQPSSAGSIQSESTRLLHA